MKHLLSALTILALATTLQFACDGEKEPYTPKDTTVPADTQGGDAVLPMDATDLSSIADTVTTDTDEPDTVTPDIVVPPEDVPLEDVSETDVPAPTCPAEMPGADDACVDGTVCAYGQECCCGECFDSLVCNCSDGQFACYNTDACYGGNWCGQPPCCNPAQGMDLCADWQDGSSCQKLPGADYGKCLMPVKAPSCWTHADCADGETCQGAAVCPCDADCDMEDTPGTCVNTELPQGCCFDDGDCDLDADAAFVCSWNDMSGDWGRCLWLPDDGSCWDDGDCAPGEVCNGAQYCPCDALCGMADMPGKCMDPNQAGDVGDPCGQDGGPCKTGLVCCYPCGIPDCIFECAEPCDASEPWCEGGCPLYA
jgi:hypothetical protein